MDGYMKGAVAFLAVATIANITLKGESAVNHREADKAIPDMVSKTDRSMVFEAAARKDSCGALRPDLQEPCKAVKLICKRNLC